ncbi:MAG: hypothetical protein ACFNVK_13300, partial [Prevotella sp.]
FSVITPDKFLQITTFTNIAKSAYYVAFDVSMQTFGVVSIASVVPAHLFLGVGVCLLGLGRMSFVV